MNQVNICNENKDISIAQLAPTVGAEPPKAWEQIETGRFQPRRIRGSLRGRELG